GLGTLKSGSFFVPGLILGVGASLGASGARQSIGYGLLGAILIASLVAVFYGVDVITSYKSAEAAAVNPPPGIEGLEEVPDPTSLVGFAIVVLFISSFFYAFGPLTLAMAATCLLTHLTLDWLNDLPLPWQSGDNQDENWLSNDVAGGALIIAASVWIFAWPPVRDVWYTIDPQAEARAAIANLDSFKTKPLIKSEKGRESLRLRIANLREGVAKIENDRCASTAYVRQDIEYYFSRIRVYEDWQPGTELSPFSKEVVAIAEKSLQRKYFAWDRLPISSRIHLDGAKYGTVVAERPSHCAAKGS
ncbi:MAG: hypothetical protein Q7T14_10340, partial [Aestuariivirga sp.]|nr:hypothetical protein [Aestuariivirga sp.]